MDQPQKPSMRLYVSSLETLRNLAGGGGLCNADLQQAGRAVVSQSVPFCRFQHGGEVVHHQDEEVYDQQAAGSASICEPTASWDSG